MTSTNPNLRKAAVLLRSLDGETASTMLAQLSPAEAAKLRDAIRALGPVDADEQADVVAEFRRITPLVAQPASDGVELSLSSSSETVHHLALPPDAIPAAGGKRFEFLERAPIHALVPYLAREHVQTVAVVLSHLRAERAAAVLAALSGKRQAEVIERLAAIGDTDPDSVTVVEHELAAWVEKRTRGRHGGDRRNGAAATILAAMDTKTRDAILANLKTLKSPLAEQIGVVTRADKANRTLSSRPARLRDKDWAPVAAAPSPPRPRPNYSAPAPLPRIEFDQLIQLDDRTLAAVLRDIDPGILVLALAGSREDLIDRICDQMPKRVGRTFRRQLRRLGPTRLSDVETAQRAVASAAAQRVADRRPPTAAVVT